jgi:hypothetical protein
LNYVWSIITQFTISHTNVYMPTSTSHIRSEIQIMKLSGPNFLYGHLAVPNDVILEATNAMMVRTQWRYRTVQMYKLTTFNFQIIEGFVFG